MKDKSMTALMCLFVRTYHNKVNEYPIYKDNISKLLITDMEYENIANSLTNGINYFYPNFKGTKEETLRWIIDNVLSSSILARSIFTLKTIQNEIRTGTKEYIMLGSGYDTFAYQNNKIKVFELDKKEMIEDKINRLQKNNIDYQNVTYCSIDLSKDSIKKALLANGYDNNQKTIISLLGLVHYLTKEEFNKLLNDISELITDGSSIIFDYPITIDNKINKLTKALNEEMKVEYDPLEMNDILLKHNFIVFEELDNEMMDDNYYHEYNTHNKEHIMNSPENTHYCLAVKKS